MEVEEQNGVSNGNGQVKKEQSNGSNGNGEVKKVESNGSNGNGDVKKEESNGSNENDTVAKVEKVDNWAKQQQAKNEKIHHKHKGKELHIQEEYIIPDPPKVEFDGSKHSKKGRNKNRPKPLKFTEMLCHSVLTLSVGEEVKPCKFNNCKYTHDIKEYMSKKQSDIGAECWNYRTLGKCERGFTCRFAMDHVTEDFRNKIDLSKVPAKPQESNRISKDVQIRLRKKEYVFDETDDEVERVFKMVRERDGDPRDKQDDNDGEPENKKPKIECPKRELDQGVDGEPVEKKVKLDANVEDGSECPKRAMGNSDCDGPVEKKVKLDDDKSDVSVKTLGAVTDEDLIKVRDVEKKRLDWTNKTYLAPLTTVGNLPFRRICKRLGADITCGEMALGLPLLQGHGPEWALLQRHHSEDMFGIQVCGRSPNQMARVAQLIEEQVDCDFVDINMGCPIDLIYKKGMGSGLMQRKRPLEVMVRTMSSILSRPLTVKMRKGVYDDKNIAHQMFPALKSWGAQALTIHGRSREQRYTRDADWDYIMQCAETVNIPTFGNGDVMNFEDYNKMKEDSKVAGIMLARGALIKPWLFTEIKEQRHWDISAVERLDIIKEFCNYGLEHWGSDDKGVENTRRFLLEWLSFMYRYAPHGILMYPPQRLNERLPFYQGRSELETLLCSPNGQDWVKITEMFLGKVKDDFNFVAKHKANSFS